MLSSDQDRCFVLTAPGTSALAVVRLAGPGVMSFFQRRFSRVATAGRPVHGELRDDAGVIDDPVVVLREDGFAADLTLHGGAWIAQCVIALAEADGFALSPVDVDTPGSTDARTLFEHELLVSLTKARTELAARTLLAQPDAWRELLASEPWRAAVPAAAAPRVPPKPHGVTPSNPVEGAWGDGIIGEVLADRSLEHLLTPPTLAIVGLPNAGKSTLANRLFGQQRSIVSPVAGTTRDWVGEEANLDGLIVRLIDTPGRRATTDAIEAAAIAASDRPIAAADAVLLLLDATRDDAEQDAMLAGFAGAILVLNKIDQRRPAWSEERVRSIGATTLCARTGDGIAALTTRLQQHFGVDDDASRARVWTARQRELLRCGRWSEIIRLPAPLNPAAATPRSVADVRLDAASTCPSPRI